MHGKVRQSLINVLVRCGLVGYGGVLLCFRVLFVHGKVW